MQYAILREAADCRSHGRGDIPERMSARFDTLVVGISDERLCRSDVFDYLQELDAIPARQIVLQLEHVSDDVLPRVAAFARYLGTRRSVALCGVRAGQVARLKSLGIDSNDLLVGRWPTSILS
jgi:hypothetical protein